MQSLALSWNAFKWSSNTEDVFIENQKVECSIKLTKEKPNQGYLNCDGKSIKLLFTVLMIKLF